MSDDVAQIVVTSHSPVFYNLVEKNSNEEDFVSCLHVHKLDDELGTQVSEELSDLDERMGTTAVLAPKILALEESIRSQQEALIRAEQLAAAGRAKIFVEGTSDRTFVTKLFNEFAPGVLGTLVDIETLPTGAGHFYVGDMLKAWYCTQKHRGGRPRAIGILDNDKPGSELRRAWNQIPAQAEVCKCFVWDLPPHIVTARQQRVILPVTLEELYPLHVWEQARLAGHLEDRELVDVLPPLVLNSILRGERGIATVIQPEFEIYGLRKFVQEGKTPAANQVAHWHSDTFEQHFHFLRPFVQNIVTYLEG